MGILQDSLFLIPVVLPYTTLDLLFSIYGPPPLFNSVWEYHRDKK